MKIDPSRCTGCGACVRACPFGVLTLIDGVPVVGEGCTLCGACSEACPQDAIRVPKAAAERSSGQRTLVFGEWDIERNVPKDVVLELLSKAREWGGEVDCLTIAPKDAVFEEMFAHGAGRVIHLVLDLEAMPSDLIDPVETIVKEHAPSVILLGATPFGREFAPRLAARLMVGLTADCTSLEMDDGTLLQTRPAFGGNIMATIVSRSAPQMATVRPHVFAASAVHQAKGEVRTIMADIVPTATVSLERTISACHGIEDAHVLISVGKGLGKEGISLAEELASLLGGEVSCSRAVVEAGWYPQSRQVGQSGRTVAPKLYIAIGISGAIQHLVGMRSSSCVVAVNNDPEAPIHDHADLSIICDAVIFIEKMIKRMREQGSHSLDP